MTPKVQNKHKTGETTNASQVTRKRNRISWSRFKHHPQYWGTSPHINQTGYNMLCQVKTYSPIKGLARGYRGLKSIKEGCFNAFMRGLKKNQIRKIKKFGQDGLFTCEHTTNAEDKTNKDKWSGPNWKQYKNMRYAN